MKLNTPQIDEPDQRPASLDSSQWVAAGQLAILLRIPLGTIRNLTSQGILPHYKINRSVRYKISEIESEFKSKQQNFGYKCHGEGNQVAPKGLENGNKKGSSDRPVDRIGLDQVASRWQNYLTTEKKSKK